MDKAVKFGTVDDDTPALVALLDALKGQVGGDVEKQIDDLEATIRAELAATVGGGTTGNDGLNLPLIIGGVIVLLLVVGGGWFALRGDVGGPDVTPTPTVTIADTPTTAPTGETPTENAPTSAPVTATAFGAVALVVFYSDADGLYVIVTETSDLRGLVLQSEQGSASLIDDFSVLNILGGQAEDGTCLRYTQAGTAPVPPRRCSGDNVFETVLNPGDVFWYDAGGNRTLDLSVTRDGEVVRVCPAGSTCTVTVAAP